MSESDRPIVGLVVPTGATPTGGGRARIWHKPGCPSRPSRETMSGLETACTCDVAREPVEQPPPADVAGPRAATPCAFCGDSAAYDAPGARTWSWSMHRPIVGLNERRVNQGASRHAYASERRAWELEIAVAAHNHAVPIATGPRRLQIARYLAAPPKVKRQLGRAAPRLLDHGNLVGGCKPILDALVKAKLLVDDDPRHVRDHYRQVISDYETDFDRVDITLTDVVAIPIPEHERTDAHEL